MVDQAGGLLVQPQPSSEGNQQAGTTEWKAFSGFKNDDEITRHLVNRFQQHKLYHQVGERVLISLNPGNIYGEENAAASTDLPEDRESLRDSLSSFISPLPDASTPQAPFSSHSQAKTSSQAQTIIALGESGSGKSTILKACIKVALDSLQTPKQAQLDDLIVRLTRTLRVADAIGNAQTRNNPDSSRMGKMIEIYKPKGTEQEYDFALRAVMFESARLACLRLDDGERAFHIFYYLAANGHTVFEKFPDLLHGIQIDREKGKATYDALCQDFAAMGHEPSEVWDTVAAVWLLTVATSLEDSKVQLASEYLIRDKGFDWKSDIRTASQQAGLSHREELFLWAKIVYRKLFLRLIPIVTQNTQNSAKPGKLVFVDICGYEVLAVNKLQQLLINVCNDKLFEQYKEVATAVVTGKQSATAPAIAPKTLKDSLLDIIDLASDTTALERELANHKELRGLYKGTLVRYVKTKLADKKNLEQPEKSSIIENREGLEVRHMDDWVRYDCDTMVEDNMDGVREERMVACSSSVDNIYKPGRQQRLKTDRTSVSVFRRDLKTIVDSLKGTDVLFIRCIKAHPKLQPWLPDESFIRRQVVNLGILATVDFLRNLPGTNVSSLAQFQLKYKLIANGDYKELFRLVEQNRALSIDSVYFFRSPLLYYSDNAKEYLDRLLHKTETAIRDAELRKIELHETETRKAEMRKAEICSTESTSGTGQARQTDSDAFHQPVSVSLPSLRGLIPEPNAPGDSERVELLERWLVLDLMRQHHIEVQLFESISSEVERITYTKGIKAGAVSATDANRFMQSCLYNIRQRPHKDRRRPHVLGLGLMLKRVTTSLEERYESLGLHSTIPSGIRRVRAPNVGVVDMDVTLEREIEAQPEAWYHLARDACATVEDFQEWCDDSMRPGLP